MTTQRYKEVADLIEAALQSTRASALPTARLAAANAIATLALAAEVRTVGLLLASGAPIGPSLELARDAYTAAAIHLDLVDPDPADVMADLYADGQDPADKDVEL